MNKLTLKSVLFFLLLSTGVSYMRAAEECCEPASQEEQQRSSVLSACRQIEQNGALRDRAIATELRQVLARVIDFDATAFINDDLDRVLFECWPSDRVEEILITLKHELLGLNPDGSEREAERAENTGPEPSEDGAAHLDALLSGVNNAFKVYLLDKLNEVEATGKQHDKDVADRLRAEVARIQDLQIDDFFSELCAGIGSPFAGPMPSEEARAVLLELWHLFLNIVV